MIGYTLQRIATMCVLIVVISILVFLAIHALPADVAHLIMGESATEVQLEAMREAMGLNDPLVTQYLRWAGAAIQGDFGRSLVMDQPILPLVASSFGRSMVLAGLAIVVVALLGVVLGVIAGKKQGSALDNGISLVGYIGISVPEFFWGIVLTLVLVNSWSLLPAVGGYDPRNGFFASIPHLILPVITLTLTLLAHVMRQTRTSMIEQLSSNYVRAARARGFTERRVLYRHALPNGLLPTITVLAHDFGWLLGGVVVIETIFAYPGLGRLMIFAIERHDIPLVQAIVVLLTTVYMMVNLVADLLYTLFNPQIRYGNAG